MALNQLPQNERQLNDLINDAQKEVNWNPSCEFHKVLIETVLNCDEWEPELKTRLLETADQFYRKYASKKKKKAYLAIIEDKKSIQDKT